MINGMGLKKLIDRFLGVDDEEEIDRMIEEIKGEE